MPSPEETYEANLRLAESAEHKKAPESNNEALAKVEAEKKKSLQLMQAELRKQDDLDKADRMNALKRITTVLKVGVSKTAEDTEPKRAEYVKAQTDSAKEVGAATLAAAGALSIDAGSDIATGGLTAIPVLSHLKDLASSKAANEIYRATTGKDEDMIKGVDNAIAFVCNFIPGLNSVISPATVAAMRITLEQKVASGVRDIKMAATLLPEVVNNVRDANEALNKIAIEQQRNNAQETQQGTMQAVGSAA